MANKLVSTKKPGIKPVLAQLIYSADAANWKDAQNKAQDLYRQGKLFNLVLRGVGSVGDFEISKNRIYTNNAISEAFTSYNNLINEFPYYRLMFDSHPSSESDESPELGEGNSYDNVGGYLLKLRLEDVKINGNTHKAIKFDYAITKQSVLDYFMRAIDPILAISHRGFMGNIDKVPRSMVKDKNNNVTFLNEAFNSLDFWDSNSDSVDYVEFLRLLGFDLVTYPADFFCVSRKQDIVGYNVTDYASVRDNGNISNQNLMLKYMNDKCVNITSPYSVIRLKHDNNFLERSIKSEAVLDEVKFLLKNGEVNKMNITLEKITDRDYMFGLFDDLAGMFIEVNDIWTQDSAKIGDWIDDALKDEFKSKIENKDEFVASITTLMDNHEKFQELFVEQNSAKIFDHNTEIIKAMVDAVGLDTFKVILDKKFNVTDEDVSKILTGYQENNPELYESVNANLITMAGDLDYYKQISDSVLSALTPATDGADTPENTPEGAATDVTPTEDGGTPPVDEGTQATEDAGTEDPVEDPNAEPIEDGVKFAKEPTSGSWEGSKAFATISELKSKENFSDSELKKIVDEAFAVVRGYDNQKCFKLPHHEISVDGNSVTVTLSKSGVLAAAQALVGARTSMIASKEEKHQAAQHLMKHYDELGMTPPESLTKIADNAKFADLVIETDLVLALDEEFIKKIINEDMKIDSDLNTEQQMISVLDAIYIVMRPFVKEGAKIDINEDTFNKLAQTINGAAIGLAAVMNGEGNDIMTLEDNAIISTMREQINNLKDELTKTKDNALMLTKERDGLLTKVTDYETKIETIGQLSADVNAATSLVEELTSMNTQKMNFLFNYRNVIDEEIFKEILGAKTIDQLGTINKWVTKMGNKKVVLNNVFTEKITTETPSTTEVQPTTESTILRQPTVDTKPSDELNTDDTINTILRMIKSK